MKLTLYGGHFDVFNALERITTLEKSFEEENFWEDHAKSEQVTIELNRLKEDTTDLVLLKEQIEAASSLLVVAEQDSEMLPLLEEELLSIEKNLESVRFALLFNGPYDKNNCILEIHAGAGGTEACDWAAMLFRMYLRYCEKKGYKTEVLEYLDGEEAGLKSASIEIKGKNVYGYLKGEKGVHRLVRLSPFDSNNRRHTSFASVDITPESEKDVNIEINEIDLKIDVYRASGAGGQHVNTTDSAVRITHLPTKIVVTCQNERSQIQNREMAMKILKSKLQLVEMEKQQQEMNSLKGEHKNIEFGSQIRSYVLHPYSLIKDARTGVETSNVDKVLDGDLDLFIDSYLKGGV